MSLDYISSVPLHVQLKVELEKRIRDGQYQGKIPSERELMEEFHVSRSTVRQSIEFLVREGILEKRHGRGTFVTFKPIQDWLGTLSSTSEIIKRMGRKPGAKLIRAEIVELNFPLTTLTGMKSAYHFVRVRYADHLAIGIERHYYPIQLGEQLIKFDLNQEAFYDLLEKKLGVQTFSAKQTFKALMPTKEEVELLDISSKQSMLNVERIVSGPNNEFIEYENALYRGDLYTVSIKTKRRN